MKIQIISVGTEILLGDIVNTNAAFLSKELAALGFDVLFQHTVGDNTDRLKAVVDMAFSDCDLVITTGGLGPTADDLTKETCAEYFGLALKEDKKALCEIEKFFAEKNVPMAQINKKQALMPEGSIILYNDCGTAPGCIMEKDGKTIVVLPGPPREMKPMFFGAVVPYLSKFTHHTIKSHNVRTFGIGESSMSEKVADLFCMKNPTVAPYAKSGEALLRVTVKAETSQMAQGLMQPVLEEIKNRLNDYIYAVDADSIEQATVEILKNASLTVAAAESCTGGLVAKRITGISGSSAVFKGGVVCYTNEVKENVLGVKKESLNSYGAVSPTVAAEMAMGAKRLMGTDIAVSVTGMAGPESDEKGKEVGEIYIGIAYGKTVKVKKLLTGHKKGDCREYNRIVSASNAINEVRKAALKIAAPLSND